MKFKRQFGEVIPGLKIHGKDAPYPVLNERNGRASAGIMLALGIIGFVLALFTQKYIPLATVVALFAIEFGIRIFLNPNYAPLYAIGSFIVRKQNPQYSGAIQKRFAWALGFGMAFSMIFISIVFQIRGIVPFSFCAICLLLMWLEITFSICVGCKIYYGLQNIGWIKKPLIKPACPGNVCSIQKPKNE